MDKYIVTDKGPIDRRKPGENVTDVYDAETMARLVDDGYVELVQPVKKSAKKRVK